MREIEKFSDVKPGMVLTHRVYPEFRCRVVKVETNVIVTRAFVNVYGDPFDPDIPYYIRKGSQSSFDHCCSDYLIVQGEVTDAMEPTSVKPVFKYRKELGLQ